MQPAAFSRRASIASAWWLVILGAVAVCAALPYCINLTDVFADVPGVYLDARHQNQRGAHVLATTVYEQLGARELLRSDVSPGG